MDDTPDFFLRMDTVDTDRINLYGDNGPGPWMIATFDMDWAQKFFGRELCEQAKMRKTYIRPTFILQR